MNLEIFLQYFINGLTYGAIYALIALGFSVIYRTTEIINFAQGEFVMLGGMFMFTFTKICGLNLWLALILTILTVSIIGIIIQQLFIRPAINSPLVSIIIITIGLSIAIQTTAMLLWGKNSLMLDHFSKIETIKITDEIIIATQNIWILAITIILMFILHY
ncbi:MAG TPA: branched-chain amino acid ABC transporter permease, partial [bacterium]|nr:branched-chain amino acid ABC transporter permease [bacterium]